MVSCEHMTAIVHEHLKEVELLEREGDGLTADADGSRFAVECDLAAFALDRKSVV